LITLNRSGQPSRSHAVRTCRKGIRHFVFSTEKINMIKKLLFAVATMIAATGFAFAQVDVNKADAAALDSVKGVGPKMSKAILDERAKGEFKDWSDFQMRVKGIGDKNAVKLSAAGLQVNGKGMDGAAAPAPKAAPKTAGPSIAAKPAVHATSGKPPAPAAPAK
jgi:competence protein ComEA